MDTRQSIEISSTRIFPLLQIRTLSLHTCLAPSTFPIDSKLFVIKHPNLYSSETDARTRDTRLYFCIFVSPLVCVLNKKLTKSFNEHIVIFFLLALFFIAGFHFLDYEMVWTNFTHTHTYTISAHFAFSLIEINQFLTQTNQRYCLSKLNQSNQSKKYFKTDNFIWFWHVAMLIVVAMMILTSSTWLIQMAFDDKWWWTCQQDMLVHVIPLNPFFFCNDSKFQQIC